MVNVKTTEMTIDEFLNWEDWGRHKAPIKKLLKKYKSLSPDLEVMVEFYSSDRGGYRRMSIVDGQFNALYREECDIGWVGPDLSEEFIKKYKPEWFVGNYESISGEFIKII